MTEEELDLLYDLKNEYWHKFSDLVNETLNKAPKKLQGELKMMLQEASSVYGRKDP